MQDSTFWVNDPSLLSLPNNGACWCITRLSIAAEQERAWAMRRMEKVKNRSNILAKADESLKGTEWARACSSELVEYGHSQRGLREFLIRHSNLTKVVLNHH